MIRLTLFFCFPTDNPFWMEIAESDQETGNHPGDMSRSIHIRRQERHDDADHDNREYDLFQLRQ